MYGLVQTIFKMLATENGEKSKLGFFLTKLLFIIDFHYSPLGVCLESDILSIFIINSLFFNKGIKIRYDYQQCQLQKMLEPQK